MIELQAITKSYQTGTHPTAILKGIDLQIDRGEFLAIMGPSGSGKSTLMNILGLLDRATGGSYRFENEDIHTLNHQQLARRRNLMVGFVFQSFFLLPKMDALSNVCLPLTYQQLPNNTRTAMSKEVLATVGLAGFEHRKPTELSGGQQQRVAIARALVTQPKIILADEPTGSLDSATGQEIFNLLLRLNRDQGTTIIVVTHDQSIADQCQRIIHLRNGMIAE